MTRLKISKTLLAVMLTSAVATGSAYAENNAQTTNESAGQKVDSSMNKVGNFMDDSAITAKVKAALVDHENIDNEYMYYTPDRCMEEIADNLKDMYDFVRADEYSIYYEVYQNHSDWCDTVLTQAEELVQAYAGVDPQVIESGEIRTMSKTRLIVLLEGSYRQNES